MKTYVGNVEGVMNKEPVYIQKREFTKSLTLWSSVFSGNKNICVAVMYKHVLSHRKREGGGREREREERECYSFLYAIFHDLFALH